MSEQLMPQHINITEENVKGNNGIGRYIFLTGSNERAEKISESFLEKEIYPHPRHHNFYQGKLGRGKDQIDVAAISTGMGGPSADIIINELLMLGARRLLRVGTAGSLQSSQIKVGDIVVATGAVRDDKASWDYIYKEYPAIASFEYLKAIQGAVNLNVTSHKRIHFGLVHSKSSLYARELHCSLLAENDNYMAVMQNAGVLATEMECAQLFTLASLNTAKLLREQQSKPLVHAGAILAIIGDDCAFSENTHLMQQAIQNSILLSIEATWQMNVQDCKVKNT